MIGYFLLGVFIVTFFRCIFKIVEYVINWSPDSINFTSYEDKFSFERSDLKNERH